MMPYKKTCLAVALSGGLAVAGHAISLTDYTFPNSTSQQAYVNGTFNANGNSIDTTQIGYILGGSGNYWLALRSLPFSYDLTTGASFATTRGTADGAEAEDSYDLNLATNLDKYLSDFSKTFIYGAGFFDYRKLSTQEEADDPRIDVEAGIGVGRTINATVLKLAVRMDEDFVKYGVTTRPMSDEALLQLAAIIDREAEFRSVHGAVEYRKYWYEAMEKVLVSAGVLAREGLSAMGVLRIQEVMAEPTAQRWHGWSARVGVGARISDYDGESGDPTLVGRLEYHRPIGFDLQVSNRSSVSTIFADEQNYHFMNAFRVDYEISNRVDWYNGLTLNYDLLTADDAENILEALFNSTFIFYLENRLSINPELQFRYRDNGIGDAEWDWAFLGGITYRLK